MSKFEATPYGNHLLRCDGFAVSFRAHGTGPLAAVSFLDTEKSDGETAIVHGDKFYILNGDHRAEYSDLSPKGLSACLAYFELHSDQISGWSNRLEVAAGGAA